MKKGKKIKIGLEKVTIAKLSYLSKSSIRAGSRTEQEVAYTVQDGATCGCQTIEPESLDLNKCPDGNMDLFGFVSADCGTR